MWLCTLLVTGSACSPKRLVTREDFRSCCTRLKECLALLQEPKAPGPDTAAIPWSRLTPEAECAAVKLAAGWVGSPSKVLPHVVALLSHPEPRVRNAAASSLRWMGEKAREAVPALIEAHEKDPRGGALAALVSIDDARAVPLLRRFLQAGAPEPLMPCLGETLAPVLREELENPESPLWARKWGLPRLCPWQPPEVRASFQELLRRELAEPSLRRPSGAACREPAPSPCQRVLDGCLPHDASLVHLLSGVSSEELLPELVAALAREEERLTPFALEALAHLKSPEAFPHLIRQLSSPRQECRQLALDGLAFIDRVPPEASESLLGLLERGEPSERSMAALLLWVMREPRAIEPLRRALKASQTLVRYDAARALGGLGAESKASVPELEELARTDASQDVRWAAAEARYRLSDRWEPAATPHCPRIVPALDGWILHRRHAGPLRLRRVPDNASPEPPPHSDPCSGPYAATSSDILIPMGQACLFGASPLGVWEKERNRMTLLEMEGGPVDDYSFVDHALDFQGTVVLLRGWSSVSWREGWLERVTRTREGAWMLESFAPLPGMPVAYALDETGGLVIATTSRDSAVEGEYVNLSLSPEQRAQGLQGSRPVPPFERSCREYPESGIVYVVRVTPDGQVGPFE